MNFHDWRGRIRTGRVVTQVKTLTRKIISGWLTGATTTSGLQSLTPTYIEDQHSFYVDELIAAIRDPKVRNIALSGGYGVGKSSILSRVSEIHSASVIELSLSTLAPIIPSEEGLPLQATTPTNQIQQEIVKQLLYRELPRKAPGSRFRRIERFSWAREIFLASVLGTVFSATLLLTGWTERIIKALPRLGAVAPWEHLLTLLVGSCVLLLLRRAYFGRFNVKQVTAGAATVTLDEKSVSYFDQYLDEIVYFFEVTKRTIVVFEDIDRFNDAHIFETLRSLNTLLNASRQIKGPVKFIYAVRDSIFDRSDLERQGRSFQHDTDAGSLSELDVLRANRTKFFDLVIPVVPFITHQSARNLAHSVLQGSNHLIAEDLIDLASRHVAEMRLLKNIRNEFVVFRDRLLSGDGRALKLSESELFAMVLYKNTYLSDFESIRFGSSKLDKLYEKSRQMVAANIDRLESDVREIKRVRANRARVEQRARSLGEKFREHISMLASVINAQHIDPAWSLNGHGVVESQLTEEKFWAEISGLNNLNLQMRAVLRTGSGVQLRFSKSDIEAIVGEIRPRDWEVEESVKLAESEQKKLEEIRWFKTASMQDLIAATDRTVSGDSGDETLDAFSKSLLGKGLAYDLVRSGYINRNFVLYTATFHGYRVSPEATNFIVHNLERGVRDENFQLTAADVEALVREYPSHLGDPVLYNIDFIDHVIESPELGSAANKMVAAIARMGADEKAFLGTYLSRGSQRSELIRRLVALSQRVLSYLVEEAPLDLAAKRDLLSVAIASVPASAKLAESKSLAAFIKENYEGMAVFAHEGAEDSALKAATNVAASLGVSVARLRALSDKARNHFVAHGLYDVTEENLQAALGHQVDLSLDSMRDANPAVFERAASRLGDYLECIEGSVPSVRSNEAFVSIVKDLSVVAPDSIDRLIDLASDDCMLEWISSVPKVAWPAVVKNRRCIASLDNVGLYLDEFGQVDEFLAQLLKRPEAISSAGSAEEERKVDVARAILRAGKVLAPEVRAKLCSSLEMSNYLDVSDVEPEEGDLFALLIGDADVLSDESDTYKHILRLSWDTKERYIKASTSFCEYASPELIGDDLKELLTSKDIPEKVKLAVVRNADAYVPLVDDQALAALATVAAASGERIGLQVIERAVKAGVPTNVALRLIVPNLDPAQERRLSEIISLLGDEYSALTVAGKDRPKVAKSPATADVLRFLAQFGVVTSFVEEGDSFRVSKRHS